jgi:hypothetical protein
MRNEAATLGLQGKKARATPVLGPAKRRDDRTSAEPGAAVVRLQQEVAVLRVSLER